MCGEVSEFLSKYPVSITEMAERLRTIINLSILNAREELDRSAKMIGYSLGAGYRGMICTIIPSRKGVKLGIPEGVLLVDPEKLLEGSGKRHRYVTFKETPDVERPEVRVLLKRALTACHKLMAAQPD
jgi:hypothetical protein